MADSNQVNQELIADCFLQLDRDFSALYALCTTDAQRSQLTALRDAARDAFWAAQAKTLADSHDAIIMVQKDLEKANQDVKNELAGLKNIVKILGYLADAVKAASALATMAAI